MERTKYSKTKWQEYLSLTWEIFIPGLGRSGERPSHKERLRKKCAASTGEGFMVKISDTRRPDLATQTLLAIAVDDYTNPVLVQSARS